MLGDQYCDGLRGPLVIYDKDDPHMHRYDGQYHSASSSCLDADIYCS